MITRPRMRKFADEYNARLFQNEKRADAAETHLDAAAALMTEARDIWDRCNKTFETIGPTAAVLESARATYTEARQLLSAAVADLETMPGQYADLAQSSRDYADTHPEEPEFRQLADRLGTLSADRYALHHRVQQLVDRLPAP